MSTVTPPSSAARAASRPAPVSITSARFPASRIRSIATQRAALPQASASPPSALRMRMKAAAPAWCGGSITTNWSQPTPSCRSAIRRTAASLKRSGRARASSTTKSLPSPCILMKSRPLIAAYIGMRDFPVQRRAGPRAALVGVARRAGRKSAAGRESPRRQLLVTC
jgi:hypothetical protein